MLKTIIALLAGLLISTSTLLAGDAAERRIIGFSPEGKWFAFEQFGVQDGSGFPFHEIFVVDLETDTWAPNTPVRVRLDTETASAHEAWQAARVQAAPVLAKLKIINRGILLASNPVTEVTGDNKTMTFQLHKNLPGADYRYTFKLKPFTVPAPQTCAGLGANTMGFALRMANGDRPFNEVYRDGMEIPKSRGCPLDYAISDVVIASEVQNKRFVVLIHVFSYGFEGPDARFIALPITAP